MENDERGLKELMNITARAILSTARTMFDQKRQIRVGITVEVGGKVYETSLKTPTLAGDETITERRIKADIIT